MNKLKKIILAIICFVSSTLFILYDIFGFWKGTSWHESEMVLRATAYIVILLLLLFCFVFKHSSLLILLILAGIFCAYIYPDYIYTFFPLFLSLWYVNAAEHRESGMFLLPYYVGNISACVLSVWILFDKQRNATTDKIQDRIYVIFCIVLGVLLCIYLFLLALQHRKKQSVKCGISNKEWKKKFENGVVIFFFLEAVIMVLNIIFWCKMSLYEAFCSASLFAGIFIRVYVFVRINVLRGKTSAISSFMHKIIKL